MHALELKIPPPIVALLTASAMWIVAQFTMALEFERTMRIGFALMITLAGGVYSCAGAVSFRMAKTTVNPLKPERASALVKSGVYRITRNPMYVGLLLVLCGWLVFLATPIAVFGPVTFWAYINAYQIKPEERVLLKLFGNEYDQYCQRVRRWF